MTEPIEVKIAQIRVDGGTQPRAQLNYATVTEYAEAIEDGASFPPIELMYDGNDYWLWDGFHRLDAHKQAGCTSVRANVKQGTRRDAVLASVGANSSHGLQRTNADKRRAVETLLSDAEWVKWSDREIARRCAVGHQLVASLRKPILDDSSSINNGRTFIHPKTGQPTTMNTANIGKASTPPVSTIMLQPKPATDIVTDKRRFAWEFGIDKSTKDEALHPGEVVRSDTRFTMAPPIRDDETFDDDDGDNDRGYIRQDKQRTERVYARWASDNAEIGLDDLGDPNEHGDENDDEDGYEYSEDDEDEVPVEVPVIKSGPNWTKCELDRKELVLQGLAVHANMKTDVALIEWAKERGIFTRVDRATEWGNPFHLPGDGDRETVIANYEWYLSKKPSLMAKINTLKGKVLGCWCYPEGCHAGHLEELANGDN